MTTVSELQAGYLLRLASTSAATYQFLCELLVDLRLLFQLFLCVNEFLLQLKQETRL